MYNQRCQNIYESVQRKDVIEKYINDTPEILTLLPGAYCIFELNDKGDVVKYAGEALSILHHDEYRSKLSQYAKTGRALQGRYIYLKDPDHSSLIAIYIKSTPHRDRLLGAAIISACKMKMKSVTI